MYIDSFCLRAPLCRRFFHPYGRSRCHTHNVEDVECAKGVFRAGESIAAHLGEELTQYSLQSSVSFDPQMKYGRSATVLNQ